MWLAFTDSQSADNVYVVLVSPSGVMLREKLAMPVKNDAAVEWTDDAHLQMAAGAQTFKFVVNGSEVQELP